MLLTGAGTVAAYQLNVPPFQSLEDGVRRAQYGIPVTYTNSLDRQVECLAFIEYRNLDENQRAAIENIAQDARWENYGQRTLAALDIPNASPEDQNEAIAAILSEDLRSAAHGAVPEMAATMDRDAAAYNGHSLACPEGVDGLP